MKTLAITGILLFLTHVVTCQSPAATPAIDSLASEKQRADRLQQRLFEYANWGRYGEANAKVPAPAKGEERVVFMGDSITDSWKLDQYFPGMPYINRGISGQTTSQMLLRFRPDVIDLRPKVVVILAGTNDIAGNTGPITLESIEGNLASMVDLARANGIKVVLSSVMPISDYNKNAQGAQIIRSAQRPPERIKALNAWIRELCNRRGLVYLDYFTIMVDDKGFLKPDIANDGLHPNAKGYQLIQPLTVEAIKMALKQKQR